MWLVCYDNIFGNWLCCYFLMLYVKMLCVEVKIRLKFNDCEYKRYFGLVFFEGYSYIKIIFVCIWKVSIWKMLELNMVCCVKWNSSLVFVC